MATPNMINVANVVGGTAVANLSTTAANVVVNAAGSNTIVKINTVIVSNIDGTASADVTLGLFRSSVQYNIASTVSVPADASIVIIGKDSPIYLEEGDAIRATASANGDLQTVISYEIVS